jgi:hypothetical protein
LIMRNKIIVISQIFGIFLGIRIYLSLMRTNRVITQGTIV